MSRLDLAGESDGGVFMVNQIVNQLGQSCRVGGEPPFIKEQFPQSRAATDERFGERQIWLSVMEQRDIFVAQIERAHRVDQIVGRERLARSDGGVASASRGGRRPPSPPPPGPWSFLRRD